ncbi:hypothetical protein ACFX12_007033 [Malus domestica]
MAQRHLVIFSSAWHSNISDHPLHCIVIVFAFKADRHSISEREDTARSTSRNREDKEDAMQQWAEAQWQSMAKKVVTRRTLQ